MYPCRIRRKFHRGEKRQHQYLLKRLRKAKKEAPPLEKPEVSEAMLSNKTAILGLSNDLETGCPKLAMGKILGVLF